MCTELAPGRLSLWQKSGNVRCGAGAPRLPLTPAARLSAFISLVEVMPTYIVNARLSGCQLAAPVTEALGGDLRHAVFSFIPQLTAEVAFIGMCEGA